MVSSIAGILTFKACYRMRFYLSGIASFSQESENKYGMNMLRRKYNCLSRCTGTAARLRISKIRYGILFWGLTRLQTKKVDIMRALLTFRTLVADGFTSKKPEAGLQRIQHFWCRFEQVTFGKHKDICESVISCSGFRYRIRCTTLDFGTGELIFKLAHQFRQGRLKLRNYKRCSQIPKARSASGLC